MIPKTIHYCWFGGKKIPDDLEKYIKGWSLSCPDYKIQLWNEASFDIESVEFVKTAYNNKKYAFVSDYVRAYALYNFGGIYLDTDVELRRNLDAFLSCDAFSGFESQGLPFTAVWGSKKGHVLAKKIIEHYKDNPYFTEQQTNTNIVSKILIKEFKINPLKNELQIGSVEDHKINIFPSEYFCIDLPTSYAVHHFHGSWIPHKKASTKDSINIKYHIDRIKEIKSNDQETIKALAHSISLRALIMSLPRSLYYKLTPNIIDAYIRGIRKK